MQAINLQGPAETNGQVDTALAFYASLGVDVKLFKFGTQEHSDNALQYLARSVVAGSVVKLLPQGEGNEIPWTSFFAGWADGARAAARYAVDGKPAISAFHGPSEWVTAALTPAEGVGYANTDLFAMPAIVAIDGAPDQTTLNAVFNDSAYAQCEVLGAWCFADSIFRHCEMITQLGIAAAQAGKQASAPIYFSEKAYPHKGNTAFIEGDGFRRLRDSFAAAIAANPALTQCELITANDFAEHTYFGEFSSLPVWVNHWNILDVSPILSHEGFAEFAKRYITWFRTGSEPAITTTEFFYAYRLHPRTAREWKNYTQPERDALREFVPPTLPDNFLESVCRREPLAAGVYPGHVSTGSLAWARGTDRIWGCLRVSAADAAGAGASVRINGVVVASGLAAGEHLVAKNGTDASATGETDRGYGTTYYTFTSADYGQPLFEVLNGSGAVIQTYRGELAITEFAWPGCWGTFARKGVPGRAFVRLSGVPGGGYYPHGSASTLAAQVGGDISSIASVQFYDGATLIGSDSSSPYSVNWTPTTYGAHVLTARAVKADTTYTESEAVVVYVAPADQLITYLQDGSTVYTARDIAGIATAGSTSYNSGTGELSLTGHGDGLAIGRFCYREITAANCTITARLVSKSGSGRAGVMMLNLLHAEALWQATCSHTNGNFARFTHSGVGAFGENQWTPDGSWFRLVKTGTTVEHFTSPDATIGSPVWTSRGSENANLYGRIFVGLFANGGSTAVFNNLTVVTS